MNGGVSVITAALPSRLVMLAEAQSTVAAQTVEPAEHLVALDYARDGTGTVKTRLAAAARGEWVATLDDDDLLDKHHLETLTKAACGDVVYSWCRVDGSEHLNGSVNQAFDPDRLRGGNYIPATALIRRDLVADLGGWRRSADVPSGFEDWDFWLRALDAGAVFQCVPTVTWTYRFHQGNKTIRGERGAF